jgi:CMP-N,N'-diacetyllegionaminic acid synthase
VPRKNISPMLGKSLIQRAFEVATASGVLDRIMVSTDDPEIAERAREIGIEVPFLRPPEFSRDDSPMMGVAIHCLTFLEERDYIPNALMLLQPTSPLRKADHIRAAVELLGDNDSVCSVTALPQELSPHFLMRIGAEGFLKFFMADGEQYTRRQDVPVAYKRDGTIYLTKREVLVREKSFYGERCVPMVLGAGEGLTIDSAEDWSRAEEILSFRDRN